MKKKILLSVLTLFVLSIFAVSVNAATVLQIPYLGESKAPNRIPSKNEERLAVLSEPMDFSSVTFNTADGATLNGSTEMQKIIIFDGNKATGLIDTSTGKLITTNYGKVNQLFEDWYTAYCLDASKKYPLYGLYNNVDATTYAAAQTAFTNAYTAYATAAATYQADPSDANRTAMETAAATADAAAMPILNRLVRGAFVNSTVMKEYVGNGQVVELDSNNGEGDPYYTLPADKTPKDIVYGLSVNAKNDITVTIGTIKVDSNDVTVNKEFMFSPTEASFDKYFVSEDVDSKYSNALWILEHSYPTLTLQKTLENAEIEEDALKTEVSTLSGITGDDLDKYVEGYVYATIQYAVWKSVGAEVEEKILGDSINNAPELNKLYQYLTKENHSGYGKPIDISTKISISGDTDKYTDVKDGYRFGPFKASYKAIENASIKLALDKSIDGVKIVDKDGKEIAEVANGGEFYIISSKKAKIGNIKLNATTTVNSFSPTTNRARIYNPVFGEYQNAITGGILKPVDLKGSLDILVNAKTGIEDVAVLLMVTLVAFSLGYLVLSYKTKPVELN